MLSVVALPIYLSSMFGRRCFVSCSFSFAAVVVPSPPLEGYLVCSLCGLVWAWSRWVRERDEVLLFLCCCFFARGRWAGEMEADGGVVVVGRWEVGGAGGGLYNSEATLSSVYCLCG